MMELSHIALVKWHLFEAEDIPVFGNIGVIGDNRTGKSSLLDMIQVVMTGAARDLARLNASANQGGQKRGGRTIHAYCLGRLGEGDNTLRDESLTYLALTFADPGGKRRPVSIGVALEARRSESQELVLARFVTDGVALSTEDFLRRDSRGDAVQRSWDEVREVLAQKVAAAGGELHNHRDAARDYVREYMRLLLTGGRYNDERQFQRSFVNAISFEHMQTATDFVRKFILEDNPVRIKDLRESISTYREIRQTIEELTRKLSALKAIHVDVVDYAAALAELDTYRWMRARAQFLHAALKYGEKRRQYTAALAAKDAATAQARSIQQEIDQVAAQLDSVELLIAKAGIQDKRRILDANRKAAEVGRDAASDRVATVFRALRQATDLLQLEDEFVVFETFLAALQALNRFCAKDAPPVWPREPVEGDQIIATLAANLDKPLQHLQTGYGRLMAELQELATERANLERQLSRLAHGEVLLDPLTEAMCERLRGEGMNPRIVCSFLDMKDETWRDAAEALLGRDREAIIVDAKHVDRAFSIRRRERRQYPGVRLVNTPKLDERRTTPEGNSLASVISSSDPIAMAFVVRRIGNVRLAHTQSDLYKPGRAVMKDGTYDDGLVVEVREVRDRKIGAKATQLMQERLSQRLEEVGKRQRKVEQDGRILAAAVRRLEDLKAPIPDGMTLGKLAEDYRLKADVVADVDKQIAALEKTVDPRLARQKEELSARKKALEEQRQSQHEVSLKQESRADHLAQDLDGDEGAEGSRRYRDHFRDAYRLARPLVPYSRGRVIYGTELNKRGRSHRAVEARAQTRERELTDHHRDLEGKIRDKLTAYFADFGLRSEFNHESRILTDVRPWLDHEIEVIEANELTRYEAQARAAADRASVMFRNSFVNELRARFDNVERDLDELNATLRDYPLHNERYTFTRIFREEYRAIYSIVELSKASDDILLPLFQGDVPEDHPHREDLKAVEDVLLSQDFHFEELQDYRNFYTFDLVMEDLTSGRKTRWGYRRGIGSGGEQQSPFYVAIGASLAAVYHGRNKAIDSDKRGIGLAVFDEAFSKLDEKNQFQLLSFYKSVGLQTFIAAPTASRRIFYENMDNLVEVFRHGDRSEAHWEILKPRVREELAAINPQRMEWSQVQKMAAREA